MSYSYFPEQILQTYSPLYRRYFKLRVWLQDGRHYDAPLRPFKLLWIDPDEVGHTPGTSIGSTFECSVKGGNWDCDLNPLEQNLFYQSFKQHINDDVSWEETEYYTAVCKKLRSEKGWKDCSNKKEVKERLQTYDRLYNHIDKYGYSTQQELRMGATDSEYKIDIRYHPPEFDEITVDIGRDGTFIWFSGIHRLTIARILDIESVPVRVRIRHAQWQEVRDRMWNAVERDTPTHPDLLQSDQ